MKIALVVIGKTDAGYFVEAINEYKNRLVHYIPFEMEVIPDIKNVRNLSESQQKEKEGELILKTLQPGDYLVLLDEKGKEFTSVQFAAYMERCIRFRSAWFSLSAGPMVLAMLFIKPLPRKYP